jgi:hypothetical protein
MDDVVIEELVLRVPGTSRAFGEEVVARVMARLAELAFDVPPRDIETLTLRVEPPRDGSTEALADAIAEAIARAIASRGGA